LRTAHQSLRTLAVVPYVSRGYFVVDDKPNPVRSAALNATLWSVGAQFPTFLIATCSGLDAEDAQRSGFPIWRSVVMQEHNGHGRNCKQLYGWALEEARRILESQEGDLFDYVYFTEADQVLNARKLGLLFDSFRKHPLPKANSGHAGPVLVAHRQAATPHMQSFSRDVQLMLTKDGLKSRPALAHMERWMDRWEGKEVFRFPLMTGSCCENPLEPLRVSSACDFADARCRPDNKDIDFAVIQFGFFVIPFINAEALRQSRDSVSVCKPSVVMESCR